MNKKSKVPSAKIKSLLIPQYSTCNGTGYEIKIVVTKDPGEFVTAKFSHLGITGDGEGASHVYASTFESWIILPEDASISTVVHECWHCVYRIMKKIGAEIENEVVAYTLGWLTEEATEFLYSTEAYQKKAKEFLKKKLTAKSKKRRV